MSWGREDMLQALMEQAPAQMVVLEGPDLEVTYATGAVTQLLGDDLVGRKFGDLYADSSAAPIIQRVYATGVAETVTDKPLFTSRPSLASRYFTRTYTPLKDREGVVQGVVVHSHEVTHELQTRHALEESEKRIRGEFERFFALFEEAPINLAVVEPPKWKLVLANRGVRTIFGDRNFMGVNFADMVSSTNRTLLMLERVYATGRRESFETLGEAPGFEGRAFIVSMVPVNAPDGTISSILVSAFEMTEQRQARHELESAREEAIAAARAKDQFLAMLGHELRNPLQPMLTGVQLMRLDGIESPALDMLERELSYVVRLVEDLLDISRISRGMITLKREPLNIHSIVNRGLELASPLLEETQHRVNVETSIGTSVVAGDPHRLAQVVSNLIQNAAKYSAPGSTIRVTAESSDDRLVLRVADDGVGIAPEMLPRVFEAFVQVDQPLDRSRGGLGIGLSIVKSLVEAHGGTVSAHSDGTGRGSTFTVEIPAHSPRTHRARDSSPLLRRRDPSLAPIKVLVVDDNARATDSIELGLTKLGYHVSIAYDGPSALVLAKSDPPHIALLDIGLPVMDGYRLGEILRAEYGIPIVAVSGYGQPVDRGRSRSLGFAEHLVKPVDLGELVELFDKLVG